VESKPAHHVSGIHFACAHTINATHKMTQAVELEFRRELWNFDLLFGRSSAIPNPLRDVPSFALGDEIGKPCVVCK
jgi:hypothetical protein